MGIKCFSVFFFQNSYNLFKDKRQREGEDARLLRTTRTFTDMIIDLKDIYGYAYSVGKALLSHHITS